MAILGFSFAMLKIMAPAPVAQKRFHKTVFVISLATCSEFIACIAAVNIIDYEATNMFLTMFLTTFFSMTVLFPGYFIISVPNLHQTAVKKVTSILKVFSMGHSPEPAAITDTINLPERQVTLEPRSAYIHYTVPTISARIRISNDDNQALRQNTRVDNNDARIIYVKEYVGRRASVKPLEPQGRVPESGTPIEISSHANRHEKKRCLTEKRLGFPPVPISVSELRKTCDKEPSFTDISKIPSQDSECEQESFELDVDSGTFWNQKNVRNHF